jgi:hypothetical protein
VVFVMAATYMDFRSESVRNFWEACHT